MINWSFVQEHSTKILHSGLIELITASENILLNVNEKGCGNYLIEYGDIRYIGEAQELTKRIRQHSKEKTSTFFKNYRKYSDNHPEITQKLEISDFRCRWILANLGRKEMEQHGIVNLPAVLNKFQKSKAVLYNGKTDRNLWSQVQEASEIILSGGEQCLDKIGFTDWFDADCPKCGGIYWVENSESAHIYIGESSELDKRLKTHSTQTYFSALRRHIGENLLGFSLQARKGKKRYFDEHEDLKVTEYLRGCRVKIMPVSFARFELEEALIKKYSPILNRKGK